MTECLREHNIFVLPDRKVWLFCILLDYFHDLGRKMKKCVEELKVSILRNHMNILAKALFFGQV